MFPVILKIIFTFAVGAALLVGPCALLFYLGRRGKLAAEKLLLAVIGVAIAVAVVASWGDYGNVHGGAILLVEIMLISAPVVLAELILLTKFRTKARLLQFGITLLYPSVLIYAAFTFGS